MLHAVWQFIFTRKRFDILSLYKTSLLIVLSLLISMKILKVWISNHNRNIRGRCVDLIHQSLLPNFTPPSDLKQSYLHLLIYKSYY